MAEILPHSKVTARSRAKGWGLKKERRTRYSRKNEQANRPMPTMSWTSQLPLKKADRNIR
jgi:hypothetical protein